MSVSMKSLSVSIMLLEYSFGKLKFPGALLVDLTSRVHHQIIPLFHVCRYTPVFRRWVVWLNDLVVGGSASTQSIKSSLLVHFRNHEGSPPLFRKFFCSFRWYNVLKYPYVVSYRVSFCTGCFLVEPFPLPCLCLLSVPSTQVV